MSGKISIIIPVRNEAAKIEQCLEAVFNQTIKPYKVIVVDGHSTDNTVENSEGDFVGFTDANCIPERNWLENLIKEFDDEIVVGVRGEVM